MHLRRSIALTFTLSLPLTYGSMFAQKQVSSADGEIVTTASAAQAQEDEPELKAPTPSVDAAWNMLTTATHKATQTHIVALAALGTMGTDPRAAQLIREAMGSTELELRTAAIVAAGQTKNRALIPALRERLKDPEPEAAFTAAVTLWKMNDRSGEPFLRAVVEWRSQRQADPHARRKE